MPGYKGHLIGGVLASVPLFYLFSHNQSYITIALWAVCVLVGALFPDIDTKSKGQKWLFRIMVPLLIIMLIAKKYFWFGLLTCMLFAPLIVNHRGLFHRLWFILLFSVSLAGTFIWYFPCYSKIIFLPLLFFFVGAISHLILDFGIFKAFKIR